MANEAMFDRAFAIRGAMPWKKLDETEMFAVRFSDGEIGCCSVTGRIGEHLALILYSPTDGMRSMNKLFTEEADHLPHHLLLEHVLCQDCIQVSFENTADISRADARAVRSYAAAHGIRLSGAHRFPVFMRYRPLYMPSALRDKTEQQHLLEAMDALLEISRRLKTESAREIGLQKGNPFLHPMPLLTATADGWRWESYTPTLTADPAPLVGNITDELALARLKKSKKPASPWALAIFLWPMPLPPTHDEAPIYPFSLCVVTINNGMLIHLSKPSRTHDYAASFSSELLATLQKHGRPSLFLTMDDRTTTFILPIAEQLDIPVMQQPEMPPMVDLIEDLYDEVKHQAAPATEEEVSTVQEVLPLIRTAPDVLKEVPNDMLTSLHRILATTHEDDSILRIVEEELQRRHLPIQ